MSDIKEFYEKNNEKKYIEKELKNLRGRIIDQMGLQDELIKDEYLVTYKSSYSYTVNEEGLIERLLEIANSTPDSILREKILDSLEVKLTLNSEKLESLIYNGYISEAVGKDFTETKETKRFVVKKFKK